MATSAASHPNKQRIFLVDDHPIVCRGLRMLILDEPDMEVCGEAAALSEALEKIAECRPNVVIVDLALKIRTRAGTDPADQRPP